MKMTDIALARSKAMQARPLPPDMQISSAFETVIEPNAAAKERIKTEIEQAKASGIVPPEEFQLAVDEQDVVVYKCITVTSAKTPGGLAIPNGQLAQARLRGEEFQRMPLTEVMARSNEKFREMFGG